MLATTTKKQVVSVVNVVYCSLDETNINNTRDNNRRRKLSS